MRTRPESPVMVRAFAVLLVLVVHSAAWADPAADLQRGKDLMKTGDYAAAIQALEGVASADPALATQARLSMGRCYQSQKKYAEAVSVLKQAAASSPKDAAVEKDISFTLAQCYCDSGDQDSAIEVYKAFMKDHPADAVKTQVEIGRYYVGQKKYTEAIAVLKEALAAAPDASGPKGWLERCYRDGGDWDSAIAMYRKLGITNPEDAARAECLVGLRLRDQGKRAESIAAFKKAIAAAPRGCFTGLEAKNEIVLLYREMGSQGEAIEVYNAIAEEFPAHAIRTQVEVAKCYHEQKIYAEAVAVLKKTVASDPKNGAHLDDIKDRLEKCCLAIEDWDTPVEVYQMLGAAFPEYASRARLWEAIRLQKKKNYDGAIAVLKDAMVSAPKDSVTAKDLRYQLAECYRDRGDKANATAQYEQIGSESPEEAAKAGLAEGKGYQKSGDYARAIKVFEDVVVRYPDTVYGMDALWAIDESYRAQSNYTEDLDYMGKLLAKESTLRPYAMLAKGELLSLLEVGRFQEATVVLKQILTEYPKHDAAKLTKTHLVFALANSDQVDEAGEIVKGMMAETQSPPEKARLQAWLGDTYFQAKRYSEAAQVFADVLKNKEATTDAKAKATYEMAICHDMLGHHTIAQNYMTKVTKSFPDTTWAKKARGQLYLWLQSQPNGQDTVGR